MGGTRYEVTVQSTTYFVLEKKVILMLALDGCPGWLDRPM